MIKIAELKKKYRKNFERWIAEGFKKNANKFAKKFQSHWENSKRIDNKKTKK